MKLKAADHVALAMIAGSGLLTAALYPRLPDQVPVHFDVHGTVNGWMARETGAWLLPVASLGTWLLLRLGGRLLPHAWRERMAASPTAVAAAILAAFSSAIQGLVLYAALVKPPTVAVSLGLIIGAFWIALGLVLPRIRRNPWLGVRTPWTLSSDENWARTHRIAGYAFTVSGALALVAVMVGYASIAPALFIGSAIVPMVYSFVLARQLPPSS